MRQIPIFRLTAFAAMMAVLVGASSRLVRSEDGAGAKAEDSSGESKDAVSDASVYDESSEAIEISKPVTSQGESTSHKKRSSSSVAKQRVEHAAIFLATPDWEFDGFVAGAETMDYRTIYYLGDLLFLNIGTQQGLATGDHVTIYKRGARVRDPQSGKPLGYEMRRAGYALITDRIEENTATARIMRSSDPIEIGDLVRRED